MVTVTEIWEKVSDLPSIHLRAQDLVVGVIAYGASGPGFNPSFFLMFSLSSEKRWFGEIESLPILKLFCISSLGKKENLPYGCVA